MSKDISNIELKEILEQKFKDFAILFAIQNATEEELKYIEGKIKNDPAPNAVLKHYEKFMDYKEW